MPSSADKPESGRATWPLRFAGVCPGRFRKLDQGTGRGSAGAEPAGHCGAYALAIKGHRFDPTELDTLPVRMTRLWPAKCDLRAIVDTDGRDARRKILARLAA